MKSLKSYNDFSFEFLRSSQDSYPKSEDNLEQLDLQKFNKVKIGKKYKVEEFIYPVPQGKTTYHNGYLKYVLTAWLNDCGIELGPWHVWNIVFHQLCQIVKNDLQKYRDIFTTSAKKITIEFGDGNMFDIDRFINEIKQHVPLNIDTFIPQFPNQPPLYRECMYGLFADMVHEYYGCMIFSCSIPKVRVLGTDADWAILMDTVKSVNAFFTAKNVTVDYLTRSTSAVFEMIANLNNADYWSKFFFVKHCGSGSEQQIDGHVLKLLAREDTYLIHELPDMISRYPFEYLHNGNLKKDMNFVAGILFSSIDNEGYLVQEYHTNITYYDYDLCKIQEHDNQELDILIEFLKRMKKYCTDDSNGYLKNHVVYNVVPFMFRYDITKTTKDLQEIPIPEFESYYKSQTQFAMGPKKDLLYRYKKLYEKEVKSYTKHNQRVRLSQGNINRYLELLEEERKAKREKKHYFWAGPQAVVKRQKGYIHLSDLPALTYDTWVNRLPLQADDMIFIEKYFDLIYAYIANNHAEMFSNYMINMYNPEFFKCSS